MEGKLIKIKDNYQLYRLNRLSGPELIEGKLSLKNCEAISNGYDLDELVKERFGETFWHDGDKHFKEGFQKALEILGDKKFSEDDLSDILVRFLNDIKKMKYRGNEVSIINQLLQSLQQTEWFVEICCQNDCYGDYTTCKKSSFECQICTNTGIPKLDEDGCLILRRK